MSVSFFFGLQSMRGLCREEDYVFLGMSEKNTEETEEGAFKDDSGGQREERVRA